METNAPHTEPTVESQAKPTPDNAPANHKPYVASYGEPIESAPTIVSASIGMVLLALAIGFVIGLAVWAILWVSSFLVSLVWTNGRNALDAALGTSAWWFPLVVCTLGGLLIGLWTKAFNNAPKPLEEVMAEVKQTGSYRIKGLGSSIVSFLLPLAFGGSIGPEAGLTGIIAAACSWIGNTLKRAGLKVKAVADLTVSATLTAIFGTPLVGIVAASESTIPDPGEYTFRRSAKIVLYVAAAFGAFGGIACFVSVFGSGGGLPHFDAIEASGAELLWTVPCIVAGYVLTLVFHTANTCAEALAARLEKFTVLKPLLCGIVMGLIAIALPYVLFSGEDQCSELMQTWGTFGGIALVATGVVKAALTPTCIAMGWRGGNFFPSIFAGAACGFGIAALTGADPMLCVAVTTTAFLAGVTRKALLTLALLIMCFPVSGMLWMGLAALICAALPLPRAIRS